MNRANPGAGRGVPRTRGVSLDVIGAVAMRKVRASAREIALGAIGYVWDMVRRAA